MQVGHQQILTAPIPEVCGQGGATYIFFRQRAARLLADFFEFSVMQVVKQKRPLSVAHTERLSFHLWIHVTIRDENVGPSVVVIVKKLRAKTEIWIADGTNPCRARQVGELAIVIVVVEVVGIVRKIGLHNIGPSVAIVVGRVHTHASLFASVGTVGHASLGADFGESTLAVVVIEQ